MGAICLCSIRIKWKILKSSTWIKCNTKTIQNEQPSWSSPVRLERYNRDLDEHPTQFGMGLKSMTEENADNDLLYNIDENELNDGVGDSDNFQEHDEDVDDSDSDESTEDE